MVLLYSARVLLSGTSEDEVHFSFKYMILCILLVLFAGICSGLTLGLLSLDKLELEVVKRSGTPKEQYYAARIAPLISNTHYLLVTLLLCNAGAMETLPIFLDKMVHPITAIVISVTAVLFFGEIIPQSICSKYGLAVGSNLSLLVRVMMVLCFPLAWPIGRLLDRILGHEHTPLFRRAQLKALVNVHSIETGLGGKLTSDEINVITGALDLTHKIAFSSMTPLDKVFMLSLDEQLTDQVLDSVLETGHSRIPVHRGSDKNDLVGLVLVKELLRHCRGGAQRISLRLSHVPLRPIPRLYASTPMYDLLKFFQTGKSHMVLLIQPNEQQIEVVKEEYDIDSSTSSDDEGASHVDSHGGSHVDSARRGKPKGHKDRGHKDKDKTQKDKDKDRHKGKDREKDREGEGEHAGLLRGLPPSSGSGSAAAAALPSPLLVGGESSKQLHPAVLAKLDEGDDANLRPPSLRRLEEYFRSQQGNYSHQHHDVSTSLAGHQHSRWGSLNALHHAESDNTNTNTVLHHHLHSHKHNYNPDPSYEGSPSQGSRSHWLHAHHPPSAASASLEIPAWSGNPCPFTAKAHAADPNATAAAAAAEEHETLPLLIARRASTGNLTNIVEDHHSFHQLMFGTSPSSDHLALNAIVANGAVPAAPPQDWNADCSSGGLILETPDVAFSPPDFRDNPSFPTGMNWLGQMNWSKSRTPSHLILSEAAVAAEEGVYGTSNMDAQANGNGTSLTGSRALLSEAEGRLQSVVTADGFVLEEGVYGSMSMVGQGLRSQSGEELSRLGRANSPELRKKFKMPKLPFARNSSEVCNGSNASRRNSSSGSSTSSSSKRSNETEVAPMLEALEALEDRLDEEGVAEGQPLGVITIEDVIEELLRVEIVDETDRFVDNEKSKLAFDASAEMTKNLPARIKDALQSFFAPVWEENSVSRDRMLNSFRFARREAGLPAAGSVSMPAGFGAFGGGGGGRPLSGQSFQGRAPGTSGFNLPFSRLSRPPGTSGFGGGGETPGEVDISSRQSRFRKERRRSGSNIEYRSVAPF